jgi:hypothetical protein
MIVIVDIDNTLSINKKRYTLATKSDNSIDWDVLYDYKNVISDKPNLPMIDIINHLYNDYGIYVGCWNQQKNYYYWKMEILAERQNL